ncbi:hypothetical protein DDZ13_08955 [Coraliomargarita sinensis]|uniref:Uncharacterized protein n=1 Tax=Coraliomargarita sinensis TaxID=2174842 RepID=A0A317ZJR1_9BACT|nr:hypothetical protein [Coraliomargarita sinensis]PXA04158.1 hypothetical protein DDZ13_08955 [Coraliomargarita sinensis]
MLFIYIGLVAAIAIWGTKKEAAIMTALWGVGLVAVVAAGKDGKEAGYIFNAYQAIAGIYMAFRLHLLLNKGNSNMSDIHTDEPFEFTPLNHNSNDPRVISKHPIDGPDPRKPN